MHQLVEELYPFCRSITGDGVYQTLSLLKQIIPVVIYKIPTGTKAFDWVVPKEWNIKDAYIKNSAGEKIVDFGNSNLHVLNYSVPVHKHVSLGELRDHLYSIPEHPDWIPYRTSYYKEDWGFCMAHNQLLQLEDDTYEVLIDSSLKEGHLAFGECYIQGELDNEVLISTHICHPSLCNDNLSGISVVTFLAAELLKRKLRYSYRFLFIPGTIGAITWLSINEAKVKNIKHGLTAALLGNDGDFIYKKTRKGDCEIDRIVEAALRDSRHNYQVMDYVPYGYDERQFCSPGFNLPVGSLTRAIHDQYPEYHSSADNLELVMPEALDTSLEMYCKVVEMLESNKKYFNVNPKCEPNLGKRGLYNQVGGDGDGKDFQLALLWVLSLSDGSHSLLDISKRSKMKFENIRRAAEMLSESRLLVKA
jgi:aminopeptidase-like protein